MSRRLAELLAAAKLADRDVALARARAGRDSRNFATATQALASLVPAAGQVVEGYGKGLEDEALLEAEKLAADNLTATGDASETPEALAQKLVAGSKKLQAPEKKGNVVEDFLADPLGFKRRAAEKGSVAAQGKLAAQVKGNRDEAEKKGLEATKRAAEGEKLALERADSERKIKAEDEKATKAKKDEIISAAARAVAAGRDPDEANARVRDELAELGILGVGSAEVRAEFDKQARALEAEGAKLDVARSSAAENIAQAKKAERVPMGNPDKKEKNEIDLELAKLRLEEAKGKGGAKDNKGADDLRKEFNSRPEVKLFRATETEVKAIEAAAKDPSAAGDLNLITSFMKSIDPSTGVKEGEFANAQNAGGIPERIRNTYNAALSGERLTPEQRLEFVRQAKNNLEARRAAYEATAAEFSGLAGRRDLPAQDVIGGASPPASGADPQAAFLKRALELKAQGIVGPEALAKLKAEFPGAVR
jgi:hypothetical protein